MHDKHPRITQIESWVSYQKEFRTHKNQLKTTTTGYGSVHPLAHVKKIGILKKCRPEKKREREKEEVES